MTFSPTDVVPQDGWYADTKSGMISTKGNRVDLTMRDVLRTINQAPGRK